MTHRMMSPELDDIMHTVTTRIQEVILPPLIPVYFKGFVLIHTEMCDDKNK